MANGATDWVAKKIEEQRDLKLVERAGDGVLIVRSEATGTFPVGVTGIPDLILPEHVRPLLSSAPQPQFVVNVPSKALWSGSAIDFIHAAPAAFGTLGELSKAARGDHVPSYRNKERSFFERAIGQHDNVRSVELTFDCVILVHRLRGDDLTIALVDAYNMSAEDVRNARTRIGRFDIALKMSSYGGITSAATEAAKSMGSEALMLKQLMGRLAR